MKLSRYRASKDTRLELSTTAMIDVVFLLLIFFLVTTAFFLPEKQLKPNIKVRKQAGGETTQDLEPAIVDIVRINGNAVYRLGTYTTNQVDEIQKRLEQFPDKSTGAFVRMSDHVPYGMAAQAINACKESGFVLISFVPLR